MKKLSLLLVLTFMFSSFAGMNVQAANESISIGQSTFSVEAGVYSNFTVAVRNSGTDAFTLTGVTRYADGVAVDLINGNAFSNKFIDKNSSQDLEIGIYADKESAGQNFTFDLFFDVSGGAQIKQTMNVKVLGENAISTPAPEEIPALKMIAPSSYVTMNPGKATVVDVTLRNITKYAASKITIYPKASANFVIKQKDSTTPFSMMSMSDKVIQLEVTPDKALEAGNQTFTFEYTFENKDKKVFTGTADVLVKIEKADDAAPKVTMSDFNIMPADIVSGSSFEVNATIKNASLGKASNVQISVGDLSSDGITVKNTSNNKFIGEMAANSAQALHFSFNTNEKMKTGSYPITFKMKYDVGTEKKTVEDTFTYYVTVNAKDIELKDRAVLQITAVTRPTATYQVGQEVKIDLTVKNTGAKKATNVKITATPEAGVVPKSASIQLISALDQGESKTVSFSVAATAEAKSQNYNVGFKVEYETGLTEADYNYSTEVGVVQKTDFFEQFVGFNVSNPKADEKDNEEKQKSIPKIIISDYTIDPLIVMANSEFDLDLTFKNTHNTKTVSNIKVTLKVIGTETEKGDVFTPVGSSNTFYIDNIAPRATSEHHMKMFTVPDAKAKNYTITVKFEYEDAEGTAIEAIEEIGVNVKQIAKLDLGDIIMAETAYVGDSVYVSFNVHNTGKVTLNNLKIKIEGDKIDASSAEQIFGNFTSGSFDMYDNQFYPTEAGKTIVKVIVSYDDDMGEHIEKINEYPMEIIDPYAGMDPNMMNPEMRTDPMGMDKPQEDNFFMGLIKNVWFWVGVGAIVVVGVGVTVFLVRKSKKQKGFDLDE